jgi:excisionase family DNA binding protein
LAGTSAESPGRPAVQPVWYTTAEVAVMLRYSLTKTKQLVLSGQIRSIKDGGNRRILPEYVDEYMICRELSGQRILRLIYAAACRSAYSS